MRVDGAPVTIKDFEELTTILPSSYKLDLADNKIIIMPVGARTDPDVSVVLATRWNALLVNDQNEAFSSVTPNFVAEIRSDNNSEDYCHQKMIDYMNADVEEGILIDPLNQTVTVYRVQEDNIVMIV
ncbi:11182_t:CDS:2 [Funneliformis caledonium]|uniref:11182_t:CDS:1 n=1 Tax=Funneliformis caledonium TaxID=1117310 RepID=A0A9N9BUL3_9GLOM|nr:11182_t:CDS:2 [Funneliformis caledonium]